MISEEVESRIREGSILFVFASTMLKIKESEYLQMSRALDNQDVLLNNFGGIDSIRVYNEARKQYYTKKLEKTYEELNEYIKLIYGSI